jgi:hypothetical protein
LQIKGEGESRTHSGGTISHRITVSGSVWKSLAISKGWLYATHQTIPTMPSMARVNGQGSRDCPVRHRYSSRAHGGAG